MSDKSKAKWPDGMKFDSSMCILTDAETEIVCLTSEDLSGKNSDVAEKINRHRFGQICALPEIVALLKKVARIEHFQNSNAHLYAIDILKKIGEIE